MVMDITDGETIGGDGLPGPAPRKLQGTTKQKRKARKRKAETGNLPAGQLTPEQLSVIKRFLQRLFQSVTMAIMLLLSGSLAIADILHPFIHNSWLGHKTAPVQNSTRREDRGDTRVEIQPAEVEGEGGSAAGNNSENDRTEPVPCEAVGVGCSNRVPSGFCHFRQHLCLVAPHPDSILGLHQKLDQLEQEFRQHGDLLRQMELKLEKVANNDSLLRLENEELRQLNAEGYLNFAVRVKSDDFLAFAVIMALGNRKAAADHLELPHRSFYDRVNLWARGSEDHQRMFRLVEWRKKTGRKIVVRLEDSVQSGEPNDEPENPVTVAAVLEGIAASDSRDYPAILREILEVLQMQNPKNWAELGREAIGIIREEMG